MGSHMRRRRCFRSRGGAFEVKDCYSQRVGNNIKKELAEAESRDGR